MFSMIVQDVTRIVEAMAVVTAEVIKLCVMTKILVASTVSLILE